MLTSFLGNECNFLYQRFHIARFESDKGFNTTYGFTSQVNYCDIPTVLPMNDRYIYLLKLILNRQRVSGRTIIFCGKTEDSARYLSEMEIWHSCKPERDLF